MKQFATTILILAAAALAMPAWAAEGSSQADDDRYEVLVFWASWCGACEPVLRDMSELQANASLSGASVKAVNLGDTHHAGAALQRKGGGQLQLVTNGQSLAEQFGVKHLPWVVVVDADGRPVYEPSRGTPPKYVAKQVQMDLALRL